MTQKTDERARVWAAILYPESLPVNALSIIEEWNVPALLSPLHDCDINPDGEPKKPHFHLLILFHGNKSETQVCEMLAPLNCPKPEKVSDSRSYARYLCHLDNPSKAQYSRELVISFGGADYVELTSSGADRRQVIKEMTQFCEDNGILYFNALWVYAMNNNEAWFDSLCTNSAYCMSAYLKGKHAEQKDISESLSL